jgi:hypothetical protein
MTGGDVVRQLSLACAAALTLATSGAARLHAQKADAAHAQADSAASCGPMVASHAGWSAASPRVFGAYETIQFEDGRQVLCFLVLWRGAAGWHDYRAAALAAAVKDEMIDSVAAANRSLRRSHWPHEMLQWEYLGDIQLEMHYNPATRHLWIYGTDVDLTTNNVVLIDHVDRIGGTPAIVGTMHIDPNVAQLNISFDDLVKRSPALLDFVR